MNNLRVLGEFNMASADPVVYKPGSIRTTDLSSAADLTRGQHVQETLQVLGIPPWAWRVSATLAALGTSAGTPSGAFGLTPGSHGTATPLIVGESASGNSKTNVMRTQIQIPWEYDAQETLIFVCQAKITAACNTSQTLDLSAFVSDGKGLVSGSDLYVGSAATLSTGYDELQFALDTTNLARGTWLDLLLTGVADDTGGSAGAVITIGETNLWMDIRG
jgi:hypothetical protein